MISLIIPAYKQEGTIIKDIKRIKKIMDAMKQPYEIIVVVDGQVDKTYKNAKKMASKSIKVVGYPHNHGKGYAVRYGIGKSKGKIIGFIDAGMDLNPIGIHILLTDFQKYNADIVIGSKRHPKSKVNYPFQRRVISFLSQILIGALFGLNITDTQVGMKFFRRKVIEDTLPRLLVKQFAFDIEILVVAYHLGYKKIYEAPIDLRFNFDRSIVSQGLLRALYYTLLDTLAIYYRLYIQHYYDNKNKRKWRYDPELNFKVNI